jgi:hypothetical protein
MTPRAYFNEFNKHAAAQEMLRTAHTKVARAFDTLGASCRAFLLAHR